jgi:integral membrane protein
MSGRLTRGVWFAAGWLAVGIGTVAIVVPGLPTTVFFIVAAACFSRSSPRFEQWVLDRPGIGPMVRDYRSGLGMPRRAKTAAISSIAIVCSLSAFVTTSGWVLRSVILVAGAVGIAWILWRVPTRADGNSRRELSAAARWFRIAAIAEAISWLGLFVGMAVKYVGSGSEVGVQIFGPIHGVVVLVYFAVTLLAARRLRWGSRTLVLALLASVPPGCTLIFEAWAERTGRLHRSTRRTARPAVPTPREV